MPAAESAFAAQHVAERGGAAAGESVEVAQKRFEQDMERLRREAIQQAAHIKESLNLNVSNPA